MDQGPIHLVKAGLIDQISTLGWKVKFDGHHQFEDITVANDPPEGIVKRPRLVSSICKSVSDVVGAHVHNGVLPVTLGGDHSLVSTLTIRRFDCLILLSRLWEQYLAPSADTLMRLWYG